jgi:hypothetical protein
MFCYGRGVVVAVKQVAPPAARCQQKKHIWDVFNASNKLRFSFFNAVWQLAKPNQKKTQKKI